MVIGFSYYINNSEKLILNVPVSGLSSYPYQWMNAASISNKGIEAGLSGTVVKTKNGKVQLDLGLNFTQNKNRVEGLAEGVESVTLGGFSGVEVRAVVGQAYGSIYGKRWVRDAEGRVVINDIAADPNYGRPLLSGEMQYLGSPQPNWTMGFSGNLKAYGFKLNFLVDIQKGGVLWDGTRGIMVALGTHIDTENRGESCIFEGVEGHYDTEGNIITTGAVNDIATVLDESWYSNLGGGLNGAAEQFIEDASRIRLREVGLSYKLSEKVLKKTFFREVEFFVSGRNLLLWTPYTGIDPESNLYGADRVQGIDYFNLPNTRTYSFGLKVQL
jgi:hypothetical protein